VLMPTPSSRHLGLRPDRQRVDRSPSPGDLPSARIWYEPWPTDLGRRRVILFEAWEDISAYIQRHLAYDPIAKRGPICVPRGPAPARTYAPWSPLRRRPGDLFGGHAESGSSTTPGLQQTSP